MPPLQRIRDLVREWRFEVTDHAWEEMADDNLLLADVETAILTGEIVREDKDDPRGTVYVIEGGAAGTGGVGVAVRFNEREQIVIVTAYALNE